MGQFPVKFSWGNSDIMVLCYYDSNAILMWAMKNRTKEAMTEKYKELNGMLLNVGLFPQVQILDNKVSKVLLEFMENCNVSLQLVPAHIHQWNA